jgi:hypothetical protein
MGLRVGLLEGHVRQAGVGGPPAGDVEHESGQVDAVGRALRTGGPGRGERGAPAAAPDVEGPFARRGTGGGEEGIADGDHDPVAVIGVGDPAPAALAVPGGVLVGVGDARHVVDSEEMADRFLRHPLVPRRPASPAVRWLTPATLVERRLVRGAFR